MLILSIALFLYSLIRFSFVKFWWLELFPHFGEYGLLLALLILAWQLFRWRRISSFKFYCTIVLSLLIISLQSAPLIHYYKQPELKEEFVKADPTSLRLYYANLNYDLPPNEKVVGQIREYNPDIIALVELSEDWNEHLNLQESFPIHKLALGFGPYNMGIYSKIPLEDSKFKDLGIGMQPNLHVYLPNLDCSMSLIHLIPPLSADSYWHNRTATRRLSTQYRHTSDCSVIVGDFNSTPYGIDYAVFDYGAKFLNAFSGFGIPRSWNARVPFLKLPIDHVLYKGSLMVNDAKVLDGFGSDHFPLLVDFSIASR